MVKIGNTIHFKRVAFFITFIHFLYHLELLRLLLCYRHLILL